MKRDIAERWAAALEGGDYGQGTGKLTYFDVESDAELNCCLGVLCQLAVADGLPVNVECRGTVGGTVVTRYDDHDLTLPDAVIDWAGMRSNDGTYDCDPGNHRSRNLARDNDFGVPFPEIAGIIREHADEL